MPSPMIPTGLSSHMQWTKMSWGIIPGTLLIAFFLLGIDEIAIQVGAQRLWP